jgi:hypothetical protein
MNIKLLNVKRLNVELLNVEGCPTFNAIQHRMLPKIEKLDVKSEVRNDQRRKNLKQFI